jgi:hypothetical protein
LKRVTAFLVRDSESLISGSLGLWWRPTLVERGDQYIGPFAGIGGGNSPANIAITTCDDGAFPVTPAGPPVALSP